MLMTNRTPRSLSLLQRQRPFLAAVAIILFVALAGCVNLSNPPRLATATARAAAAPTASPTPLQLAAPPSDTAVTSIEEVESAINNPTLTVWVSETSVNHEAALTAMAAAFTEAHQVDVELMLVSPMLMPNLVQTAVLSNTLPDILIHPLAYSAGWAAEGILDSDAATAVLDEIGRDSFNPAALALATAPQGLTAVPSDGYQQLLVYRTDWLAQRNLPIPNTYDAMFAFAEASFDLENALTTGFVIPTESNLRTTHQAFEHIALANDCQLIDANGEVQILQPACQEALNFYYDIVHNFSPPGVQTDTSAHNAYLAGRTAMIMSSPTILAMLAGLNEANPATCPQCGDAAFLPQNSGVVTAISGNRGTSASFGSMTMLGITPQADRETAVLFANYWFNDGYQQWLDVESERKVPLRWGTAAAPRQFIDAWGTRPLTGSSQSLTDLYGAELVASLRDGTFQRWGLPQGQGALLTKLYEELTFSIVLQEMLSGYFNSSQTLVVAYNRIVALIPNYPFLIEPTPEPTPQP